MPRRPTRCRRCCQSAANYSSSECPCDLDVVAHLHEWLNEQSGVEYEFVQVGGGGKAGPGTQSGACAAAAAATAATHSAAATLAEWCSVSRLRFLPPSPAQGALAILDMAPACSSAVPPCLAIDGVVAAQGGKP